ncbi:MAG: alkaline phosphatase family protein [Desulfurococcaceae archaeon]
MRAALLAAIAIILALGLAQASAQQQQPPARKVVLLSIDAMRADLTWNLTLAGQLQGFRYIVDRGTLAQGMIVSFPSSTAVSHAVLSTGAPPAITGITGNVIHLPGTPLTSVVGGFNGSMLLAEPLWVTADRQGLRAFVVSWPQSDPWAWPNLRNSVVCNAYDSSMGPPTFSTLYTTNRSVPAATYVAISPATGWTGSLPGVTPVSAWEANFTWGSETWYLYLPDVNGDGRPDLVAIVPRAKDLGKALAVLREGQWSPPLNTTLAYRNKTYVVAPLFKALNLSLDNLRIYRSLARPLNSDVAWCSDMSIATRVWNEVVVKVGMITDADYYGLVNGWYDEDTYMETAKFTRDFFMEFTRWVIRNANWDLIMTYTSHVDNVYHQFLGLTDPRMPYYDPSKAGKYWGYVVAAMKWADEFVQMILGEVDLRDTAVVVVSDHGQWPVAKIVYVNNLLEQAGLLKRSGTAILLNETLAWYNGYNQVFVNLKGREQGGIVDPNDYWKVVRKVMDVLMSARDPDTGEPVFSLVMTRDEARGLGLYGDRAGDVVLSARPGYAPYGGLSPTGSPFVNATPLKTITANHQDLPLYPELWAVFGAVGAGVARVPLGLVQSTSVAPTVAGLLGISPPLNSVGVPLPIVAARPATVTATVTSTTTTTSTYTSVSPITVPSPLMQTVTQYVTTTSTATTTITATEVPSELAYAPWLAGASFVVGVAILAIVVALARRR